MKKSLAVFLALLFLPLAAHAQDAGIPVLQIQNGSQYPSFVDFTGTVQGSSTPFDLRCGYAARAGKGVADPIYSDLLIGGGADFSRYQNIGTGPNRAVVISISRSGMTPPGHAGIQVVRSDTSVFNKDCAYDIGTDVVSGCTNINSGLPPQLSMKMADGVANLCIQNVAATEIDPTSFMPPNYDHFLQQRQMFGGVLMQKLQILNAPVP